MAKLKTGVKSVNMTEEQAQLAKMQSWDRYQKRAIIYLSNPLVKADVEYLPCPRI
jgi:hypothetical protein